MENENEFDSGYFTLPTGEKCRIIETAWTVEEINEAANNGSYPLIKEHIPNSKIKSKLALYQNKTNGTIKVIGDYREITLIEKINYELVIDWKYIYPYCFNPFGAYLIPKDITIGEQVYLIDLIEDLIESIWNQGSAFRLQSALAIWNGKDFEIQHVEPTEPHILG